MVIVADAACAAAIRALLADKLILEGIIGCDQDAWPLGKSCFYI